MKTPKVLLFKGEGIISRAIRIQTRSKYSHAAIWMPSGRIVESWQSVGVRQKKLTNFDTIDCFDVDITKDQWVDVINFCRSHLGDKYDYRSVFRFLTRVKTRKDDKWFCSELVFAAFEHIGVNLLERVSASQVSPAMLSLSPLLIRADLEEIAS